LEFGLKNQNGLGFFIQFQDAHIIDSDFPADAFPKGSPYKNVFDVRQVYAEWEHIYGSPLGFKIGRQRISYADRRIFGPGEWGNVGRYTWDALIVSYDNQYLKVDAFYSKRIRYKPDDFLDGHFPFHVWSIYGTLKNLPARIDFFWVYKRDDRGITVGESGKGNENRYTFGAYVNGEILKNMDYHGTFAYQFGKWGNDDISAYGANVRVGYTFPSLLSGRIGVEYSYASGDSNPKDGKKETFDGVFGAIDLYYGRMNLFSWMNLQDYQLTFSIKPLETLKIISDYHWFKLSQEKDAWYYGNGKGIRRDTKGECGSSLGTEWNIYGTYRFKNNIEFQAGYCLFFPGTFIKNTGFDGNSRYIFFQVFVLF